MYSVLYIFIYTYLLKSRVYSTSLELHETYVNIKHIDS